MPSPSSRRATKRRRSSITEHSLHGINTPRQKAKSVTHVSGTFRHLSLRSLTTLKAEHALSVLLGAPPALRNNVPGSRLVGRLSNRGVSYEGTGYCGFRRCAARGRLGRLGAISSPGGPEQH